MSYTDASRDTYGMYRKTGKGPGPHLMGAGTLIHEDVYNRKGDKLGDIKEFMLDMNTGKVAYAVLSFGGIMGMGDKLFAVPFKAMTLDTQDKRFILDADKDQLKNAPGFDKDAWPDMVDPQWISGVESFYSRSAGGPLH